MNEWFKQIVGDASLPHGQCYLWNPVLIWLHAVSDALIALAYFSIPVVLFIFVRKRRDLPFSGLFLLFAAFIVACGATHLLEVWTIWNSDYYLSGAVKALTALVSLAAAFVLVRVMPRAMQLRGPDELRRLNESLEERVRARTADLESANASLQHEIAVREQAESEIKRLNHLLERRVHELQVLFDVLPVGVGIADDAACRSIRTNPELARILELPRDANASLTAPDPETPRNFIVLHHDRPVSPDELPMQVCARENRPIVGFEETIKYPDGRTLDLFVNAVPVRDAEGRATGCIATFQDLTAFREALAASSRLAAIVASSEDAIIGRKLDGVVTDWNHGAEKIFGYSAAEMIGQPLDRLVPPDRLHEESDSLSRIARGEPVAPFETRRLRKDGVLIDISVMMSPIHDGKGGLVGVSKLARDITERRQAEQQRRDLDRKIQETQKIESLGILAGGIAHDFNNLLTGVLGNASLARMVLPPTSEVVSYLRQIEEASVRAAELCNQMLAYSGRGRFVLKRLDLNQLIQDTTHLISISISKTCVLRMNPSPALPAIVADPTQLRQIMMNLIINASDAIGNRSGVVAITTGVARIDADYRITLWQADELAPGDYVFLEVSDNGCGMDASTLARIFDPFFTTKFTGRGLGLAAVLGIIRGHKGGIKVYSEPGRGTTFKVFLPAAEGLPDPRPQDPPPAADVGRAKGTVLVVDDEETVRAISARMLEALGHAVELANDGREAVEKFRREPGRYEIILLDLTMPHLDGEETFRQLRHLRPGVRVVLMSGFSEQDALSRFTGKGLAGFIQKPFTVDTLSKALRAITLTG